jgi:hypothetical protein
MAEEKPAGREMKSTPERNNEKQRHMDMIKQP